MLTKLPTSVEPRAKKKMTGLQPLLVYSVAVIPTDWRFSRSISPSAGVGAAAAMAVKAARKSWNFIFDRLFALGKILRGHNIDRETGGSYQSFMAYWRVSDE